MDNPAILLLLDIAAGIILLVIEYWVIKPGHRSQIPKGLYGKIPPRESFSIRDIFEQESQGVKKQPTILDIYYLLTIGLIGALGGLASATFIRLLADDYSIYSETPSFFSFFIADPIANSDFVFFLIALFALIGGVGVTFWIDDRLVKAHAETWKRIITAFVFGIVGGFGTVILIFAVLIILFIIELFKNEAKNRRNKDDK